MQPALPGFFRLAEDYLLATDPAGGLIEASRPFDTITVYGTGFGPTNPAIPPGEVVSNSSPLLNPVTIRVGQSSAQVLYAGMTGAGVCQFNLVVPYLLSGEYPVVAEIAGVRTSSLARLRIQ